MVIYLRPFNIIFYMKKRSNKEEEKVELVVNSELIKTLKNSANLMMYGTAYGAATQSLYHILNYTNAKKEPFIFKEGAVTAICEGLDLASFELVDGIAYSIIKPNLNSFGKWIPWTVSTAALSAAVNNAIKLPMVNSVIRNKGISYDGYVATTEGAMINAAGFNVGKGMAEMLLPPKEEIGGKYIRNSLTFYLGNVGSTAAIAPFAFHFGFKPTNLLIHLVTCIPTVLTQTGVLQMCKSVLKPLALK